MGTFDFELVGSRLMLLIEIAFQGFRASKVFITILTFETLNLVLHTFYVLFRIFEIAIFHVRGDDIFHVEPSHFFDSSLYGKFDTKNS